MSYSRWMLSDLQVHTPLDKSQKYGDVGGPKPNSQFARELIAAHAEAGVRILAVTDHNSLDWWPVLNEAGKEHGVFVFPGVEVNVNKCHLLMIWQRDERGWELGRQFVASLFDPGTEPLKPDRTPVPVPSGNVLDVAKRAATGYHGLVLAPHSTMKRIGLFASNVCNISSDVAQSEFVAGFDVIDDLRADVLSNPRSEFADVLPSWFSSGDVRSISAVGKRACYLKVGSDPTLESLRQAFLMPATRIRLPASMESKLSSAKYVSFREGPDSKTARIESISIRGGFHDGLSVDFGPGLNAIIGGKGTGKSTLIEVIRFVLDQDPGQGPGSRDTRKANFPNNADATLNFRGRERELYRVEKAGSSERARLLSGKDELDIEVARRVDVRIFGQRELASLPEQPDELHRFVLARKAVQLREAEVELSNAAENARQLAEEIDALDDEVGKHAAATEELKDVAERLKRISTTEAKSQIKDSEDLQAQDAAVEELLEWPDEVLESVESLLESAEPPDVPEGASLPPAFKDARRKRSAAIKKAANQAKKEVRALAKEFQIAGTDWAAKVTKMREEYDALLADAGLSDASGLAKLQAEKASLTKRITKSADKLATRSALIPKREAAIERLDAARRAISRLTSDAVKELNEETGDRVRLTHSGLSDPSLLHDFLSDHVLNRRITGPQISKLASADGRKLAAAALAGRDEVQKLKLTSTMADLLVECPKSVLRELEEVAMVDSILVEVDIGDERSSHWTDVVDASPGQAATALLELALIAGDEPLVIDQPEDDLDNRFIYDEVVKRIAEVAERRQLIVATHNANIPVLGDAELVLALDASSNQSEVLACGGLDEAKVAITARSILEGGEAAFQARAQRYSRSGLAGS